MAGNQDNIIELFEPHFLEEDIELARDKPSAWGDIPFIIGSILERFDIERKSAIEFGVEFGYSTTALAHYFNKVIGVDTFWGDIHTAYKGDHYEETKERLSKWKNIELIRSDYSEYIKTSQARFDLAHVDIVHTYKDTYACGEWALLHSDIVIFHDTESHLDVRKACLDLSEKYGFPLYNFPRNHGLGIIVSKNGRS